MLTRRMLEEAGRIVGRVLADICTVLNPAAVILGGELGTARPALMEGVKSSIHRYVAPAVAAAAEVVPASLGVRAELTGPFVMAAGLAATGSA